MSHGRWIWGTLSLPNKPTYWMQFSACARRRKAKAIFRPIRNKQWRLRRSKAVNKLSSLNQPIPRLFMFPLTIQHWFTAMPLTLTQCTIRPLDTTLQERLYFSGPVLSLELRGVAGGVTTADGDTARLTSTTTISTERTRIETPTTVTAIGRLNKPAS